jgi:hypothetical protein
MEGSVFRTCLFCSDDPAANPVDDYTAVGDPAAHI